MEWRETEGSFSQDRAQRPLSWPDTRTREERRGRHGPVRGTRFGWTLADVEAHEELEELPPRQIYNLWTAADLRAVPHDAWARMRAVAQSHGCMLSHRKTCHSDNYTVVPYRLTVRGDNPELACPAVLDILLHEFPTIVQPADILDMPGPQTARATSGGWRATYERALTEPPAPRQLSTRLDQRRAPTTLRAKDLRRQRQQAERRAASLQAGDGRPAGVESEPDTGGEAGAGRPPGAAGADHPPAVGAGTEQEGGARREGCCGRR